MLCKIFATLAICIVGTMGLNFIANNSVQKFVAEYMTWRVFAFAKISSINFCQIDDLKTLSTFWKQGVVQHEDDSVLSDREKTLRILFWSQGEPIEKNFLPGLIVCDVNHLQDLWRLLKNQSEQINIAADLVVASVSQSVIGEGTPPVHLYQVYNIDPKSTQLSIRLLGTWNFGNEPNFHFMQIEGRGGEHVLKIRIGMKNASAVIEDESNASFTTLVEREEEINLLFLLQTLLKAMNASYELHAYPKLGWRDQEGGWTHLLGAVAEGEVHVAADTVELSIENIRDDMDVTLPIIRTTSSVYLLRPDGGRLRDVLQATFDPTLQISVMITALLLWLAMFAVTYAMSTYDSTVSAWEPTEAMIWMCSVLCMQGSIWSPKSPSGCILLIFSLMFGLITYNSFAAFVTSVLSVLDNPIRDIDDLILSEMKFGYAVESPEEIYLRSVEDPALRAFYYRGLLMGGGVQDVAEGMMRCVSEPYAFFTTSRYARRALHAIVPAQWKCRIIELEIISTKTSSAIPMFKHSPYNRLINYWLIKLRQTGVLARIQSKILPPMPVCIKRQLFSGASATDLATAYAILFLGWMAAIAIFILEILWSKRSRFSGCFRRESEHGRRRQRLDYAKVGYKNPTWPMHEFTN